MRNTEFFASEADRNRRASALRKERRANTLAFVPVVTSLSERHRFKAAIGETEWRDVVAAWKSAGGSIDQITVGQVVERFLAEQDGRPCGRDPGQGHTQEELSEAKLFADDFGSFPIAKVPASEIEEWIDDFAYEAAETFNT